MDTNIKIDCNVKLYFNVKKNLHYYRYPLKAEAYGVRINKDGIEVPQYKERRLRSDEYINRDFYKSFPYSSIKLFTSFSAISGNLNL